MGGKKNLEEARRVRHAGGGTPPAMEPASKHAYCAWYACNGTCERVHVERTHG